MRREGPHTERRETGIESSRFDLPFGEIPEAKLQDTRDRIREAGEMVRRHPRDRIAHREAEEVLAKIKRGPLEAFIIQKQGLGDLVRAVHGIVEERTGAEGYPGISTDDASRFWKDWDKDIDAMLIAEAINAAYHVKIDGQTGLMNLARVGVDRDNIDPLVRGHMLNYLGCVEQRKDNPNLGVALSTNQEAFQIVKSAMAGDGRNEGLAWELLKIRHGIEAIRVKQIKEAQKIKKAIERFNDLLKDREALGDVAHIGRTMLDIARLYERIGKYEEAMYHAHAAYESLMNANYPNAAFKALKDIQRLSGILHARNQQRIFLERSIQYAEEAIPEEIPLGDEVAELKEQKERLERKPIACIIRIGKAGPVLVIEVPIEGGENRLELPTMNLEQIDDKGQTVGGVGVLRKAALAELAELFGHLQDQPTRDRNKDAADVWSRLKEGMRQEIGRTDPTDVFAIDRRIALVERGEENQESGLFGSAQLMLKAKENKKRNKAALAALAQTLDKTTLLGYSLISLAELHERREELADPYMQQVVEELYQQEAA